MAEYRIKDTTLQGIADAIRSKKETADAILTEDMAEEIKGIETGISLNGVVEQYRVNAGATVSAGDFVEFVAKYVEGTVSATSTPYSTIKKLSSTKVAIAYVDTTDNNYGKVAILDMDGSDITIKTTIVRPSTLTGIALCVVSESRIIVTCRIGTDLYHTLYRVSSGSLVTISGSAGFNVSAPATYPSQYSFTTDYRNGIILCARISSGFYLASHIVTDSAIALVQDTKYYATSASSAFENPSVTFMSDNTALAVDGEYGSSSSSYYTNVFVFSITNSGEHSRVSLFTASTQCNFAYYHNNIVRLSDTKAVMSYYNSSGLPRCRAVTYDATNGWTLGEETYIACAGNTHGTCLCALTEDRVLYASKQTITVVNVDGSTLSAQKSTTIGTSTGSWILHLAAISDSSFIYEYSAGYQFFGVAEDGTITKIDTNTTNGTYVQPATSRFHNVGVAKTGGNEGETVEVYCVPRDEV